jgi:hypothetical protein
MVTTDVVAVSIAIAFLAGLFIGKIFLQITQHYRSMKTEVATLHGMVIDLNTSKNQLEGRIGELEAENERQRHTQSTQAAYHDALSVLMDIALNDQIEEEYRKSRMRTVEKILKTGVLGPYAYPVDPPAGDRPEKGKKVKD